MFHGFFLLKKKYNFDTNSIQTNLYYNESEIHLKNCYMNIQKIETAKKQLT